MNFLVIIFISVVLLVAGLYVLEWILDTWWLDEDEEDDDFGDTDDWYK